MKETQQKPNISQYLKGANYPADRDELRNTLKRNGAPNDVVDRLGRLPNQRFNTENDVTNAFNQMGGSSPSSGQGGGSQSGSQGGGPQAGGQGSGSQAGGQGGSTQTNQPRQGTQGTGQNPAGQDAKRR